MIERLRGIDLENTAALMARALDQRFADVRTTSETGAIATLFCVNAT